MKFHPKAGGNLVQDHPRNPAGPEEILFWKTRAPNFDRLAWATDESYIEAFIRAADFSPDDIVLDVGTGTGIVAHHVAPLVREVIGQDISLDMVEHSSFKDNRSFLRRDIRDPIFLDATFDKITARMVFHHIIEDTQAAMNECFRVLRPGGRMVFSEGVPPAEEVRDDYARIFALKEKRLTFMENDMQELMERAGFRVVSCIPHIIRGFSVRNWLENSGLSQSIQDEIFRLHVESSPAFHSAYHLRREGNDCLIDTISIILVGEKPVS